ncbi:MAG: ATP-binding protein [Methanobacteriota archaeon]
MNIVIASGKGGTGKTTVAVNLALTASLSKSASGGVALVDCDVEEPNCNIFLKAKLESVREVTKPIPVFDMDKCTRCGKCAEFCRFHAIAVVGKQHLFFGDLCHGCGGCKMVCPKSAIVETGKRLGVIERGASEGVTLLQGTLDVGQPTGVPIIRELKKMADPTGLTILDAPPGTSCPVVETLRGADRCILVTEQTPFGLGDLKIAIAVVRGLKIPFGVVINRDGLGDGSVEAYCATEGIPILARIPNDRRIATLYSNGKTLVGDLPEIAKVFESLLFAVIGEGAL